MKKLAAIVSFVVCLSISGAAQAASGCYTQREVEAEQGLRITSELMVIGLTCIKMPGGQNLYSKYQQFTQKNQSLISGYEADMIAYYRKQGSANAEKDFHTMRTGLANSISKQAIKMSTVSFCNNFKGRLDKALGMSQQDVRKWAQHVWPNSPTTHPICAQAAKK
jgi:hypothetical protein